MPKMIYVTLFFVNDPSFPGCHDYMTRIASRFSFGQVYVLSKMYKTASLFVHCKCNMQFSCRFEFFTTPY